MFVAGIGSGGTVTGAGKYLKSKNPNIKVRLSLAESDLLHQNGSKTGKIIILSLVKPCNCLNMVKLALSAGFWFGTGGEQCPEWRQAR